jgi:hypothetical protein
MILEASVSKRLPIRGIPYSSQCFSITIRDDQTSVSKEQVKEKCVEMHSFLEELIDNRLNLIRNQPEIIALPKTTSVKRPATDKQIALIHKLMAENDSIDESDLKHAMESAYSIGKVSELSTVEASMIIEALLAKDLTKL